MTRKRVCQKAAKVKGVTSASYYPHHQAAPACYTYPGFPPQSMSLQGAAAAYAAAAGPTVNHTATASAGEGRLQ
jgi:hypothetical protein